MAAFGDGYRFHVTGLTHGEDGFPTNNPKVGEKQILRMAQKIRSRRDQLSMFEEIQMDDAEVVVVSYGGTARSAKKAVKDARAEGVKAGLLRVITLWPFPERRVSRLRDMGLKAVIIPALAEMNLGAVCR